MLGRGDLVDSSPKHAVGPQVEHFSRSALSALLGATGRRAQPETGDQIIADSAVTILAQDTRSPADSEIGAGCILDSSASNPRRNVSPCADQRGWATAAHQSWRPKQRIVSRVHGSGRSELLEAAVP